MKIFQDEISPKFFFSGKIHILHFVPLCVNNLYPMWVKKNIKKTQQRIHLICESVATLLTKKICA